MSSVKKGVLVPSGEWAKHLRPYGKAAFWRRNRRAERKLVRKAVVEIASKS
mgnify:CR=1 FL=1